MNPGDARRLPAAFWYLWAAVLLNQLGGFVILFLSIYLTQARGYSVALAGLVVGIAYGGGGIVGTVLGGAAADRWGRRAVLLAAHLATAVATVLLGVATEPLAITVAAFGVGTASNVLRPVAAAVIVDVTTPDQRPRAFAWQFWAINVGFAVAAVIGSSVPDNHFVTLFLVDAAATLGAGVIVFARVPETRPARVGPASGGAGAGGGALRQVLADRAFLALVALTVLFGLVFMQHNTTMPISIRENGLPPATYGWLIAMNAALIVGGQLLVPRLARRRDPAHVLALAVLSMGGGFAVLAVTQEVWGYLISVLIWTVGEMLHAAIMPTLVGALSPADRRGLYQGIFAQAFPIAALVAPAAGGWVMDNFEAATLWWCCLALGIIGAVGHLAAGPARRRRLDLLEPLPTTIGVKTRGT